MSETTERLDAITARAKNQPAYSWPHEAQEDRNYLLTLARKQAAALEAVTALANKDEWGSAYIDTIRNALEATA